MAAEIDWNRTLREQWETHWNNQIRARLRGLTDDEYFWSPAADAWTVRPRDTSTALAQPGTGDFTIDYTYPEPVPAAFTTIAWRLAHVIVGVLAARNAAHFGAPEASYQSWEYAGSASAALEQLETQLDTWFTGVAKLTDAELRAPMGPKEPYPEAPTADLVLHINRELIHHLSEVCLLRDLYLHTHAEGDSSTSEPIHLDPEELHYNPAFTQGVIAPAGKTLYVGGQLGTDGAGQMLEGIAAQVKQAMRNVLAVLAAAGSGPEHVVKMTIYLVDGVDIQAGFAASQEIWGDHRTAITSVTTAKHGRPGALVEIDAIAIIPE
ncbi:Rid family hydrolase [Nocardia sp. SYP-A9097]|uniref:Rid family hydrolase n=1 Tax=Nocardia sp. SYP-A9097 TaxID=2663237 RepID=UPI00281664F6|nr:Rid family hydrolase [Nocardia sp. SYP-A9097]